MGTENTLCPLCERKSDTQCHVLNCQIILSIRPRNNTHIKYEHINGSLEQQIDLVVEYETYLELQDELLEGNDSNQTSLPGQHTGPTLPQAAARRGNRD